VQLLLGAQTRLMGQESPALLTLLL